MNRLPSSLRLLIFRLSGFILLSSLLRFSTVFCFLAHSFPAFTQVWRCGFLNQIDEITGLSSENFLFQELLLCV
jgi:hypothetical protein